jgi:hypothetical protein
MIFLSLSLSINNKRSGLSLLLENEKCRLAGESIWGFDV